MAAMNIVAVGEGGRKHARIDTLAVSGNDGHRQNALAEKGRQHQNNRRGNS